MEKFKMRTAALASLFVAISLAGAACDGWAQVHFGFESPAYTTGPLVGQDGWIKNTYYGAMNGTVDVSSSSPIAGAQSVVYTQTTAGGSSDVGRLGAILVPSISGIDLSVSYTIEATPGVESPHAGLFLGNGAPGGASPILAKINGGVVEFGSAGAFVPINSFFFASGERIRMTYELDFDAGPTGSMTLILENLSFPEGPVTETRPFFAGYGTPTGPEGEYVVDVGLWFRGGNAKIDDLSFTLGVGPVLTDFEWTAAGSGNWNQTTNWTPNGVPGTLPGRQTAILGASITANQTIYNNETRTLNALEINNANGYHIGGAGSLNFQADASGPTVIAPSISVLNGAHQIQLPVNLNDDTSITVAGGASLDLNNVINLNGNTLTTSGMVRINHSTVGGGTMFSTGALAANGQSNISGHLVSTGSLVIGVDQAGADSFNVLGDASLSGIIDVQWDAASPPVGTFTVVSAGGTLDASNLSLAAEDAQSFALGRDGNNLTLTFLGAAVPEPATFGMIVLGIAAFARRRRRAVAIRLLGVAALVAAVVGDSNSASAVSFNFENPPYTPGNLVGQDGWITPAYVFADPFFGGELNGTVVVSNSSPIAGSQSALYTQTTVPPSAGNTGASDVGHPFSVFAVKDGSTAIDLTASFQIRTNANGVGNGSAGFFLGRGGASPIFLLVTEANSTAGTGSMIIGDNAGFTTVPYIPDNLYEFTIEVDVDSSNYAVFSRNITAGTPIEQLIGSGPGGRFVFLGGGYASDGDDQTYTFDTTMVFRAGEARIDAITAVGDDFIEAQWSSGSGDWAANTSWIPNLVPNVTTGNAPIAIFGSRITTPQTVYTNAPQTVNGLRFDNANKYAVAGSGSVVLKANTIGGTVNPTINVVAGAHELQVLVNIQSNTTVTVGDGAKLDFNNIVALGGRTLTTSGAVDINVGVTGGGAIFNSGSLGTAGDTPIAANLTSTGKLVVDLGPANTDRFVITGTATLSGTLDVVLEPGFVPTGMYTVLTSTGALNAAGLTLDPSDTGTFTLGVSGNSLVLSVGGSIPGDFNNSGEVDGADFAQWKGDFGPNDPGSDADGDGDSDGADFLIWQRNFGRTSATPVATGVPEPATSMLGALFGIIATSAARRGRSDFTK